MNNNPNFQFGMYDTTTESVIVNAGKNSILVVRCKECNSSVIFEKPNDIAYLYCLAKRLTAYIRQTCTERKWLAGLCGCDE